MTAQCAKLLRQAEAAARVGYVELASRARPHWGGPMGWKDSLPMETEVQAWSWSQVYRERRNAARRFGSIYALPIAKRASDLLIAHSGPGLRCLEIGAGDRRMQRHLQHAHGQVAYESVDVDPAGDHDYRTLSDVEGKFDLVFAFELIEHLPVEAILPWLASVRERTRPGGKLLLSTPNTFCPPAYLRDSTHRTPLCYDELAGMCATAGWQVTQIHRLYNEALHRKIVRRFAFGWLFRLLGLDYARQIVVVATAHDETPSNDTPSKVTPPTARVLSSPRASRERGSVPVSPLPLRERGRG